MVKFLTLKKVALVAMSLSFAAVAQAQDVTGTTSLPTTTGSGGSINSGTTYPAPTASPSATPGYYDSGTTTPSFGNEPALKTTDGIPVGTGSMGTGPSAPLGNISSPQSVPVPNTGSASGSTGSGM